MMTTLRKIILCFAFFSCMTSTANAEKITRADVEKHSQAMVDLYNVQPVDTKKIYAFIKAYTVDDSIYRSNIYINDSEIPLVISKDRIQTLRAAKEAQDRYIKASARYEIVKFKSTEDGLKAAVQYTLWHDATIERTLSPTEIGQVSFTSVSDCTEYFIKTGDQVQGLENICDVKMKQEKPVTKNVVAPVEEKLK